MRTNMVWCAFTPHITIYCPYQYIRVCVFKGLYQMVLMSRVLFADNMGLVMTLTSTWRCHAFPSFVGLSKAGGRL